MECGICSRKPSSNLPFHCPTCARNVLYEPRREATRVLLEKEWLGRRIETAVDSGTRGGESEHQKSNNDDARLAQGWCWETAKARKLESEEKTRQMEEDMLRLREAIQTARDEMSHRKAGLERRRTDLESIQTTLPERRTEVMNELADSMRKGSQSWSGANSKTIDTRAFLCREAALLYRLRQKKKASGGVVGDQYLIGGLSIVDLKEINSMRLTELSASLSSTAHLVVLVSFYLAVRLPAEITLPHRDYPLPTIFTPANSYAGRDVPFPGSTPTPSSSNSPATSRHGDLRPMPRPRPLFLESRDLEEKVPQFAKKDPIAFNFFLEAISLLAWDIAWLCRSQGFHDGTERWEDVCNIGRNLWQLLLPPPPPSSRLARVLSSRDVPTRSQVGKENAGPALPKPAAGPQLGSFSHASAYSFLGSAEAQELLRGWKMSKYTMIVDPLKKTLIGEMNNAEWELLQEQEWDDGGERFDGDAAVHIRDTNKDGHNFDDARSIMTAIARAEEHVDQADVSSGTSRVKGTSGWTKVRGRDQ